MVRKLLCFSALALAAIAHQLPAQFIVPAGEMPLGRAFHGAATLGDYSYVFGGSTYIGDREPVPNSVLKAKIGVGGNLGQWEYTRSLPEARYYIENSTLVLNDIVYIIGGSDGPSGSSRDTAFWTRPGPDGHLEPWRVSPSFGKKLSSVTAVSTPGFIHIIGGYSYDEATGSESVSDAVLSSRIFPDGSMGEWFTGPQLPFPLWYHQAQVVQGRVYVWGGLTNPDYTQPEISSSVFSAPILSSGLIGDWQPEAVTLPQAFYSGASAVAGPYLMTFCPRYGRDNLNNDVWWTFVSRDGLQPWQRQPTEIPMRNYHALSTDYRRGAIYVSGGRVERFGDKLTNIFAFRLSESARQSAVESWSSERSAHTSTIASLENSGGTYSYQNATATPSNALAGFMSVDMARITSAQNPGKPLVLYFNMDNTKPCIDQREHLEDPRMQQILEKGTFAWINAPDYPQLNQQMGVYRVPTWIFYDRNGEIKTRESGVMTLDEIDEIVTYIETGG